MHFAPVIALIIKPQPAAYQQLQHTTHWDTACLEQAQGRNVLKATSQDKAFILKDTSLLQLIRWVISFQMQLGFWKSGSHLFCLNKGESHGASKFLLPLLGDVKHHHYTIAVLIDIQELCIQSHF